MTPRKPFTRRDFIAIGGAIVIAAGCVRLGFWQLSRLEERRAQNQLIEASLRAAPVSVDSLASTPGRLRRVTLSGAPDYAHEFALTGRTRNGSPGVNLITPFRLPGRDTAILVNRGWVYSPDAAQVDFARWKEPDAMAVTGYVEELVDVPGEIGSPTKQFRQMDHRRIAAQMPYPVARYYVVALREEPGVSPDTPVRLPLMALDEGPHKSYAIQWFSFAAIAVLGTAAYLASSRVRSA